MTTSQVAALTTDQIGALSAKHLGALHTGAVVSKRRDGNRVLYAVADDSVFELSRALRIVAERRAPLP